MAMKDGDILRIDPTFRTAMNNALRLNLTPLPKKQVNSAARRTTLSEPDSLARETVIKACIPAEYLNRTYPESGEFVIKAGKPVAILSDYQTGEGSGNPAVTVLPFLDDYADTNGIFNTQKCEETIAGFSERTMFGVLDRDMRLSADCRTDETTVYVWVKIAGIALFFMAHDESTEYRKDGYVSFDPDKKSFRVSDTGFALIAGRHTSTQYFCLLGVASGGGGNGSVLAKIRPITNPSVRRSLGESYYDAEFYADGAASPSTGSGIVFLSESTIGVNATVSEAWLMVHPLQVVELPSETIPVEAE